MKELTYKQIEVIDHEQTGENLKQLRIKYGLSQTDVAEEIGCTQARISQLESGLRGWTKERVLDYKQALTNLATQQLESWKKKQSDLESEINE